MFRKTITAIFVLSLAGCGTNGGLGGLIKVETSGDIAGNEEGSPNVIQYALQKKVRNYSITAQEEKRAQIILSDNKDYEYAVWNNASLGELRMAPTSTFKRDGKSCRGYRVDYWFTGTFRVRHHIPAVACKSKEGGWVAVK